MVIVGRTRDAFQLVAAQFDGSHIRDRKGQWAINNPKVQGTSLTTIGAVVGGKELLAD
jgi:hypothetical protein